jgi:Ser/Thr protein kinase RdoA (MazF antagonist)
MLGSALAKLHTTLVNFPEAHKIARSQRGMRTRMQRRAKALLVDKCWATGELSPVRTHLLQWLEIDALLNKSECQVIHNDLNAGNVLQDTKGNIWFLDFEEAIWSYLPPYFDIAKVIERFILVNEDWDIQTKITASQRLLHTYRVVRGDNYGMGCSIPVALGWLLGFSWLRMSDLLFDRQAIQHPEVRKFLRLAELLDENELWLAAL